jgi:hypothetical protein
MKFAVTSALQSVVSLCCEPVLPVVDRSQRNARVGDLTLGMMQTRSDLVRGNTPSFVDDVTVQTGRTIFRHWPVEVPVQVHSHLGLCVWIAIVMCC